MESLSKPMKLSPEVNRVLEEVRKGTENALYCAEPAAADKLFHEHVESLIEGAGLTTMQVIHYRWFLREVARLWRTRQGRDLAFHIELSLRKWRGLGLEPRTLQFLICEAHERLKAQSLTTKHALSPTEGTPSHQEAEGGDMTGLSDNTDRVPSPTETEAESTTKTPSHQESPGSDTGILESSSPGTLPGCMSGPRPPARKPDSSAKGAKVQEPD